MEVGWAPASVSRYGKALWIRRAYTSRLRAQIPPGVPGMIPSRLCVPIEAMDSNEIEGEVVWEQSPHATKYIYSFTRAVADGGDEVLGQVAVSRRDSLAGLFHPRNEWTFKLKKGARAHWTQ